MNRLRPAPAGSQRGAILILVLIAMAGVAVLGSLIIREVAVEYTTSSSVQTSVVCAAALDSAMILASDTLILDKRKKDAVDSLYDDWAQFQVALDELSDDWEGVKLVGRIVDENGLFPINAMLSNDTDRKTKYRRIFIRLVGGLESLYGLAGDPAVLADNLAHWITSPGRGSVSEDEWYSEQKPAYQRTGKLFRYPEEILLVRWPGVEPDAFKDFFYGSEQRPGLRDFISVFSNTSININTAPPGLVRAICPTPARSDSFVEAALAYRSDPGNNLSGLWHKRIANQLNVDMSLYPEDCLAQTSSFYRIELEAHKGSGVRRSMAVVQASDTKCAVLFQQAR